MLVAASLPGMMGATALGIDLGVWYREAARLQLGADAGAIGAARLIAAGNFNELGAAATQAAQAATNGGQWWGSSPTVTAALGADNSHVTVTLTSVADRYFTQVLGVAAPTITARAVAGLQTPAPCLLSLSASASNGILADGLGSISANLCAVFSDSISPTSISATTEIVANLTVGAVGGVSATASGQVTAGAPRQPDPYAAQAAPAPGACSYTNASFSGSQAFTQARNVFCGDTTISGGLFGSDTFAPGIYYVVNGNLTFDNADVTQAAGVTFVLTGSSPGAFSYTSLLAPLSLTAPASGPTAGFVIWQTCPSSGIAPANSFSGPGSVQISGEVYTPCGALNVSAGANVGASPGRSFGVVASQVHVGGLLPASLSVAAAVGGGTTGASQVALLQ